MAQLTCQNVSLGYGGKIILSELNFVLHKGDYCCIIGNNGAGKTTLMKALLRLHQPLKGTILTGDGLSPKEIGYVPQQTDIQQDFPASVEEIVLSGCQNRNGFHPFYTRADKKLANENMENTGISHLAKKCFRHLSGGQQQKVFLARALCAAKKMLLLDEPASGLDPQSTEEIYRLIKHLNQTEKITVIMISHDMNAVKINASHILHLKPGYFWGTAEEYLKANPYYWNSSVERKN